MAASVLLGFISWRFVEKDYRERLDRSERTALSFSAIAAALLMGASIFIYARDGLPDRFPYALLTQGELERERSRYWRDVPVQSAALTGESRTRQLLIIGDSHAYDLAYALSENGYQGNIKLITTSYLCFNFGHDAVLPRDVVACAKELQTVLNSPDLRNASTIFLHDHWGAIDEVGLAEMIKIIHADRRVPIYVFGPKMTFTDNVSAISREAQQERNVTVAGINAFAARNYAPQRLRQDRRLKSFFRSHNFPDTHYISVLDVQCGDQLKCEILSGDDEYLYFDGGHFTRAGSRVFGRQLKKLYPEVFDSGR